MMLQRLEIRREPHFRTGDVHTPSIASTVHSMTCHRCGRCYGPPGLF